MSLEATITATLRATQTGSNDFGGPSFTPRVEKSVTFSDADILWVDERTVATGANDDVDLAGVLTDAFGATITAAELVAVMIINGPKTGSANTTNLTIGAGSNPFVGFLGGTSPTIGPLKPGAVFMLASNDAAGIGTVTASTADILRITNSSGASATYQIAILGRTS